MNHLLAQLPATTPVPPLPGPPLWEQALLEQPWYLAGALAIAAIVTAAVMNQRGRARPGLLWGAGLMIAAAAVLALGLAVKTEREQMRAATRELVEATAGTDTRALADLLATDARLFANYRGGGLSVPVDGLDKEGIVRIAAAAMREWPLKEHRVLEIQAVSRAPGLGRTQVRVRVVPERYEVPNTSWWRIEWRRSPDGRWKATEIEPLEIPYAELAR